MATQTKPVLVGAFVILGTIIALAALIWLGATHWFAQTKTYATYFDISVQGLNIDAAVKYRGVQVGRVADIRVAPDGHLIEVMMELDYDLTVPDTMRAKVEITGITGMKYIELDFVGPEKRILHPELTFEPPYPVIPSYPGGFEEIEQALRDIYDKIIAIDTEGISYRAKLFLDTGTKMLGSADSVLISADLTSWVEKLEKTIEDADSAILVFNMQHYNSEIESILSEIREGTENFKRLFATLEKQADQTRFDVRADKLFDEMEILVHSGVELVNRTQYETSLVMNELTSTVNSLQEVIDNLNSLMMNQEAYPSNILYTAPPPKEK